ncbi:P-loop containing nucleoside triphosphate hydrolase protein [Phycomyces nitens]|nr:P-loop containing nucleoside triphosphate hydrolase protein [Phycomyces nitens]
MISNAEYLKRTSGYVARDLTRLCKRALLKSMRRNNHHSEDLAEDLARLSLGSRNETVSVEWSDFDYALSTYRPSQQIEVEASLPKRDWKDIGGCEKIKQKITQATLLPLLQPEIFTRLGVKPPSGLLLYGPTGCGKTAMVQALASESMMNVISIKGPEIFSKYLGETESKVRKLFATAKRIAPCIMFIDEMDAIGTRRGWDTSDSGGGVNERVLSTLLNEMDGVEGRQGVIVIGCTNRPDQIDDAILRPGRLDQLIYVGLPTMEDRLDIITILSKKMVVSPMVDLKTLAKQTEYCNGADLENMFREAGILALRQDINANSIEDKHLQQVLETVCKRARQQVFEKDSLAVYEKFKSDHSI